ncbi:MAG: UvrB/UvrC motif-containing protein [Gemmataceae bacterium]
MQCQRCPKEAAYHVTELQTEGQYVELRLCEDCAKKHLHPPTPVSTTAAPAPSKLDDPLELGARTCEVCGHAFHEFRNTGRLGCPHDYDSFRAELLPLLENIHGDVQHAGKTPRRQHSVRAQEQELIGLRKQLSLAVAAEQYEEAARLRDRIRALETAT